MKTISKFTKKLSAMLAAVMVLTLGLSMSVFAAQTVTIQAPEGTDPTGMMVSAYQVLNQTNVGAAAGQETYAVTDDFADFFASAETAYETDFTDAETIYLGYSNNALTVSGTTGTGTIAVELNGTALDNEYFAADLLSRLEASEIRTMSDWLTQYIKTNSLTTSKTADTWSGEIATGKEAQLSDLAEGYYAIVATNVPDGIALEQSILNTAVTTTINLKADTIPVTKTVENDNDTSDTAGETAKAAVGDKLNYTVTTRTPDLTNYSADGTYTFTISDTLTNQQLDNNSFVLTIDGTSVDLEDVTTSINYGTYERGSQTFNIVFDVAKLKVLGYSDKAVVLTYSAELMAEAASVNGNNVTLTYSNDPYSDTTSTPGDTTNVYTYGLDIQKEFSDGSQNYPAVTFQLHTGAADGALVNFEGANGVYTKADSETSPLVTNLKLSNTGSLSLSGLDEGTYYLVETAAPDDFNKVTVQIVIAADANDPAEINYSNSSAVYDGGSAITVTESTDTDRISMEFSVLNQKGFQLPTTGGVGTWMFTIGGIVLIAAAGGVFFALRRKSGK